MASKMAYLYSNDTRGISFNPNRGHMGITKTLTLVLVKILLGHVLRRMSVTSFSPVLTANRPNMITVNVQAYFAPCLSLLGHERTCPQILLGDYQLFEATQLSWWQSIVSPKGFIWVYSTHLHYTASTVAHLFMDIVGKIHGMSRSLVSNQDSLFISHFWQELFKLSGTKLHMSSAYHPQSGRQTKVINRVIEQHLRAFVHHQPLSWGTFVIWVEWSYNTSVHSGIGLSPYKITFGKKPPNIPQYLTETSNIDVVHDFLTSCETIFAELKKKLVKAQQTMKYFADNYRREVQFHKGDWVFVKLWLFWQMSTIGATHSKLAKRYHDPFKVLQKIGSVAYQLKLPPDSRIHPVFTAPFSNLTISPPIWSNPLLTYRPPQCIIIRLLLLL